jgi:hypothetical protein
MLARKEVGGNLVLLQSSMTTPPATLLCLVASRQARLHALAPPRPPSAHHLRHGLPRLLAVREVPLVGQRHHAFVARAADDLMASGLVGLAQAWCESGKLPMANPSHNSQGQPWARLQLAAWPYS